MSNRTGDVLPRAFARGELYLLASKQYGALIAAGWTASALLAAGWTASDLRAAGCTPSDLIAAGWTPSDLRAAGWTASDLRAAGWTPSDLIAEGWTASDLIAEGWTASALLAAGWTLSALIAAGFDFESVPTLEKPYTRLLAEIKAGKRKLSQREFGPEQPPPEQNMCNTPMCTAGSFVSMAGAAGYELKQRYGWAGAYVLLHDRAHPGAPPQNTDVIPDEWALAYIEVMAEIEAQSQSGEPTRAALTRMAEASQNGVVFTDTPRGERAPSSGDGEHVAGAGGGARDFKGGEE